MTSEAAPTREQMLACLFAGDTSILVLKENTATFNPANNHAEWKRVFYRASDDTTWSVEGWTRLQPSYDSIADQDTPLEVVQHHVAT